MRRRCSVDLLGLADPFDRWCASQGKRRALALRELIAAAVAKPLATAPVEPMGASERPVLEPAGARPPRCISLRLEQREIESLREQSAAAGLPAARYLGNLLAVVENGRIAIAGKDAVEALGQSNYELAWLGRKLRHIARALEASPQPGDGSVQGAALQEAICALQEHLVRAATVLADIENTRCLRSKVLPRAAGPRLRRR